MNSDSSFKKTIAQIRENFQKWQPIIEAGLKSPTQFFHYAWGDNYQEDEWYPNELNEEDKFLFQKVTVIEKPNLGTSANFFASMGIPPFRVQSGSRTFN